jgi:hypothetical protein
LDIGVLRNVFQGADDGRLGLGNWSSIVDITVGDGDIVDAVDDAIVTSELIVALRAETLVSRATFLDATSFGGFNSGFGIESLKSWQTHLLLVFFK